MSPQKLRQFAKLTATQHVVAIVVKPHEERFHIWLGTPTGSSIRATATFRTTRLRATPFRATSAGAALAIGTTRTPTRFRAATIGTAFAVWWACATPGFGPPIAIRTAGPAATLWTTVAIATAFGARRRSVRLAASAALAHRFACRFSLFVV